MNNENEIMMEGTQYSTPQPPLPIRMFTILRSCNFFNFFRMGGGGQDFLDEVPLRTFKKQCHLPGW